MPEEYEYSFMNTINNGFIHELRVSDPLSGNTVSIIPSIEDPTRSLRSFLKTRQGESIPVLVMVTLSGEDEHLWWKITGEIEDYLRMVAFRYFYISSTSRYFPSHDPKIIKYGIVFRGPHDNLVGMSTALNPCLEHVFVIGTDYDEYINVLYGDTDWYECWTKCMKVFNLYTITKVDRGCWTKCMKVLNLYTITKVDRGCWTKCMKC
jgi:hypothetical protein